MHALCYTCLFYVLSETGAARLLGDGLYDLNRRGEGRLSRVYAGKSLACGDEV